MRPLPPDDPSCLPAALIGGGCASADASAGGRPDCRTCDQRARCISYGWRSPAGIWFEHAVMIRPRPGCRGFEGRSGDIRDHFGVKPGREH